MSMDFVAKFGGILTGDFVPIVTYPFTVSIWFNTGQFGRVDTLFSVGASGDDTNYLAIFYEGTTGGDPFRIEASTTASGATGVNTINGVSSSGWNQITGIFAAADSRRIILNGDFGTEGSSSVSRDPLGAVDQMGIGGNNGATVKDLTLALLAEAAIWGRVLKNGDIDALAAGEPPWNIDTGDLQYYWPMRLNNEFEGGRPQSEVANAAGEIKTLGVTGVGPPAYSAAHPTMLDGGAKRPANSVPPYTVQTM